MPLETPGPATACPPRSPWGTRGVQGGLALPWSSPKDRSPLEQQQGASWRKVLHLLICLLARSWSLVPSRGQAEGMPSAPQGRRVFPRPSGLSGGRSRNALYKY